eukprot:jgi/Orpsp1_1/1176530/evm.model.c7180000057948.2
MQHNEEEILLPPGVKSINDLNTIKINHNTIIGIDNKKETINYGNVLDNVILNNGNSNDNQNVQKIESNLNKVNSINKNDNKLNYQNLQTIDKNNNNDNDYFEDISIINEELPKKIKPYIKKRNRLDVLKIISKKVIPNEQLLKEPIISTIPKNDNIESGSPINKNEKMFSQQNLKYLNVDGTMSISKEDNIKNIIKNTNNSNKKSFSYIYNDK